jgi:hypothetical protein
MAAATGLIHHHCDAAAGGFIALHANNVACGWVCKQEMMILYLQAA